MPRRAQLEAAIGRRAPAATPSTRSENSRPRLQHVELGGGVHGPLQIAGALAERVGEREQNAADFLRFLLLERDDVVVDLDRAERLEEEAGAAAGAAVHDARDRRAMLAAHDQHVAAVAIGDDLLLQVLRGVAAAQVRFERAAQPRRAACAADRAAPPAPGSHRRRPRTPGRSCGGRRRSRARTMPTVSAMRAEDREAPRARRMAWHVDVDRGEEVAKATSDAAARARGLPPRATSESSSRSSSACSPIVLRPAGTAPFPPSPPAPPATARGIGRRLQLCQARCAGRRLREAANRLDDPVEFEGPQGAGVHETQGAVASRYARQGNRDIYRLRLLDHAVAATELHVK